MDNVSLVRVNQTWHVFANANVAYTFYKHWAEFSDDAECLIDQHVDTSDMDTMKATWEIA